MLKETQGSALVSVIAAFSVFIIGMYFVARSIDISADLTSRATDYERRTGAVFDSCLDERAGLTTDADISTANLQIVFEGKKNSWKLKADLKSIKTEDMSASYFSSITG